MSFDLNDYRIILGILVQSFLTTSLGDEKISFVSKNRKHYHLFLCKELQLFFCKMQLNLLRKTMDLPKKYMQLVIRTYLKGLALEDKRVVYDIIER